MKMNVTYEAQSLEQAELKIYAAFQKGTDDNTTVQITWSNKEDMEFFKELPMFARFKAAANAVVRFNNHQGSEVLVVGLGAKAKAGKEEIRRAVATAIKNIGSVKIISLDALSFNAVSSKADIVESILESIGLTSYKFDKYKSTAENDSTTVDIFIADKKIKKTIEKIEARVAHLTDSVNIARDFVNEAPNILNSQEYSKRVHNDVKKNLKGVKVNILGKAELKKEKMGLFLSVNAGSAYEPQLVQLTYTPKKVTKKTKHIALVGKGLTFDTGGYSLKPSTSMVGMKFDMGGSSTVYGAFRAAVLNESPYKITCILGMTDNAVNSKATFPDSIVKARNGKTVEILNTDAEGRLVLADCLDYACDQKPDVIIDAATLTGACLIALGKEVCGLMGRDKSKVTKDLLKSAKATSEYMWELPIIDEWREDMKSHIADLKNIGGSSYGGTAKAAAFLENFIHEDIDWAHLDIAGVCDSASNLPYCPQKGGSGLIIRTLHHYLMNEK